MSKTHELIQSADLHFQLDPAHAAMTSRWPLVRIWEVNQPGYAGDFQVDFDEAQIALIHRRGAETVVEKLARGEYRLLHALADGERLDAAVGEAAGEEGCDLQSTPAAIYRQRTDPPGPLNGSNDHAHPAVRPPVRPLPPRRQAHRTRRG